MILDRLEMEKHDFEKCRGIEFDNAASMAGVHMVFKVFNET